MRPNAHTWQTHHNMAWRWGAHAPRVFRPAPSRVDVRRAWLRTSPSSLTPSSVPRGRGTLHAWRVRSPTKRVLQEFGSLADFGFLRRPQAPYRLTGLGTRAPRHPTAVRQPNNQRSSPNCRIGGNNCASSTHRMKAISKNRTSRNSPCSVVPPRRPCGSRREHLRTGG